MTSVGLMGGLFLILAQLSRQQLNIQKKSEADIAITELSLKINHLMQKKQSCTNTLGEGIILTAGTTIPLNKIKNDFGQDVFVKAVPGDNTTYSNGLLKVSSLELGDIVIENNMAELNLNVVFEKVGKTTGGYKKVVKKFPLSVELNSNNQVLYCTSHMDATLAATKMELCADMGGAFDDNTGTCSSAVANKKCPSGQYMVGFDDNMNLICTPPPSSAPFQKGFNCYLLTTYNNGSYLGGAGDSPWSFIMGNNPIHSALIWPLQLQDVGGYSASFISDHKASCFGDGYMDRFRTISQDLGIYRLNMVLHYCCR